ncbi:MAG: cupredoxin domain-containing protein, partial [Chloroflexota bacterium]
TPNPTPPAAPTYREIEVTLSLPTFTPSTITVKAGENVRFVVTSTDTFHTFTVTELGIDIAVSARQTVSREVTIPNRPGTYRLFCQPHVARDMVGTLVVTP